MKAQFNPATKQQGIALFITIIALVMLTLGGLAIIRSTQTGAIIAGNMADKQANLSASDTAVRRSMTYLTNRQGAFPADAWLATSFATQAMNLEDAANGYYPSIDVNNDGVEDLDLSSDVTWNAVAATEQVDGLNNASRFIIQRLCRGPNPLQPSSSNCLLNAVDPPTCSKTSNTECPPTPGSTMVFRVTVRTISPKGGVSFIQSIVY